VSAVTIALVTSVAAHWGNTRADYQSLFF